jgi:CHAT domain-containing protein
LLMILWMAVSRSSTAITVGRTVASTWIAKSTLQIRGELRQAWDAGDFPTVERLCRDAAKEAITRGDRASAARFLSYGGGAQFAQFQYRDALESYLKARQLAQSVGDREELGLILFNLSSLYQQVWDIPSAVRAAEQGTALVRNLGDLDYKPELLLQLGRLQPTEQSSTAIGYFRQGIEAAHLHGSTSTEARGLDLLGERLRLEDQLLQADQAHTEAYRIRLAKVPSEVGFSLAYLGSLRLRQASSAATADQRKAYLEESERFTDSALQLQTDSRKPSFPRYVLRHQRGEVRVQQGDQLGALEDFRAAIYEAQSFREHFPLAASSLKGADSGLEESIFDSFVEAAASRALETGSPVWARESFLAAEINRAASLRQDIEMTEVWRKKLPTEYWEALAELRREEARLIATATPRSAVSERLELRISEMEAQAGLDFSQEKFEKFDDFRSLKHILEGLRETEVLLSFHLGERKSFLWAVTRNSLRLFPLAPRSRIRQSIKEFRDAVESGRPEADRLGRELYQDLFGQLGEEGRKAVWLLSLEDALFELPFAALVPESGERKFERQRGSMYLVERHSVQIVPSAFLLKQRPAVETSRGRMVVVGDPIYNTADPRWQERDPQPREGFFGLEAFQIRPFAQIRSDAQNQTTVDTPVELNRLVGSAREADAVSQAWGPGRTTVLKGREARSERLLEALNPAPDVIHLATHVLAGRLAERKTFLALGLGPDRRPELLSESDIGVLQVPNALVVMTGCATATGDILAGAGLQGLTEAWAVAGARGVVATQWPVRDLSGDFLPGFYTALSSSSTAEALRKTQVAMIHSGTAYAASSSWASYELFGGAR